MSGPPKRRPTFPKMRLLDLALDAELDAVGSRALIAACRRANQSGLVYMSTRRWARESCQTIPTLRKHRNKFVREGLLIEVGKRGSGIRVFRINPVRLAQIKMPPYWTAKEDLPTGCITDPQNLKSESKGKAVAHRPAVSGRLDFGKECGVSAEIRSLLKAKFPSQKPKFDCLLHFDDPILRIVTDSAVDGIWLSDHLFAIQKMIAQAGIATSEVVVEVASHRARDP